MLDVNYDGQQNQEEENFSLKEWHSPVVAALLLHEEAEVGEELPSWEADGISMEAEDTDHLIEEQCRDLAQLLSKLSDIPGKTKLQSIKLR